MQNNLSLGDLKEEEYQLLERTVIILSIYISSTNLYSWYIIYLKIALLIHPNSDAPLNLILKRVLEIWKMFW